MTAQSFTYSTRRALPRRFLLAAVSGAAMALAQGAAAQQADTSAQSGGMLEEIVVTAEKRSESLQDVSAAVSVVGADRLAETGVTDITQVSNLASGVSITPVRTQAFIFIRGVGQTLTSPNADAAVAVNLNGVYVPAEISGTAFFDVDRVEILPGPQGTLYGRNSTGGVINIIGREPGPDLGVEGFLELGNYDRRHIQVAADLPVNDTLASRTVVSFVEHDGYITTGQEDQSTLSARETVVWTPTDRTRVKAAVSYAREDSTGGALQNLPSFAGCGPRCANYDAEALGFSFKSKTLQGSFELSHDLTDALTLTYIGGYNRMSFDINSAIFAAQPFSPLRLRETITSQSHEGRINGDWGRLQAIAGVYYYEQTADYYQNVRPTPTQHFINPFKGSGTGSAVFGQLTYSVLDTLRLTGGARLSRDEKDIAGFNSTYTGAGALVFLRPYRGSTDLDRTDWKVGVEYDLTPEAMLYANVSTGFTPGGFSTAPAVIGQLAAAPFEPVTLLAYSGGVKSTLADGLLTLNLEGFYYDYKDYQVSARDIATGQNLVFNAEKATVYGVQLDSHARPTPNDDLSLSVTYLHAVADELRTPAARFDGFDLPYSPKWTVNAYYQRSFDVGGDGAQIRGSVNFKYTSRQWALYNHPPLSDIEAYTYTDLNLGYFAPDDRWSVQAFVRNAEDELVKTSCSTAVPPAVLGCNFAPPRTYGITMKFKG